MITDEIDFNDLSFKKEFWEWFDSIPRTERERFKYYTADMAELYFYNKYYRKKIRDQRSLIDSGSSSSPTIGPV